MPATWGEELKEEMKKINILSTKIADNKKDFSAILSSSKIISASSIIMDMIEIAKLKEINDLEIISEMYEKYKNGINFNAEQKVLDSLEYNVDYENARYILNTKHNHFKEKTVFFEKDFSPVFYSILSLIRQKKNTKDVDVYLKNTTKGELELLNKAIVVVLYRNTATLDANFFSYLLNKYSGSYSYKGVYIYCRYIKNGELFQSISFENKPEIPNEYIYFVEETIMIGG